MTGEPSKLIVLGQDEKGDPVAADAHGIARDAFIRMERLIDELESVFRHAKPGEPPHTARARYSNALVFIARFLKDAYSPDIAVRIGDLASALEDLNSGTVRSFLRPEKSGGSPLDPTAVWRLRADVSSTVHLLRAAGEPSIGKAAEFICKSIPQAIRTLTRDAGKKSGTAKASVRAIRDWESALRLRTLKNDEIQDYYDAGMVLIQQAIDTKPRGELKAFAKEYLTRIANKVGSHLKVSG